MAKKKKKGTPRKSLSALKRRYSRLAGDGKGSLKRMNEKILRALQAKINSRRK